MKRSDYFIILNNSYFFKRQNAVLFISVIFLMLEDVLFGHYTPQIELVLVFETVS